mmetsp:Transcript_46055/g.112938  ORF Transcript_46055/g.112938 Transcript_46055/m.112938 type:complete len:245 (-) Transcript_46055:106-840(-)|eukprot:CAMPEP_0198339000 /NCGR_PEP_ID=MMETSP1450-20131203/37667_1 /TAXON_ID=753684 ORGANISM="Madagascaria erythrocladiodes, Strain CCMP3234" /NCGR_SAMPLE_ID=MMETSP1450 /ASSEMBLY_ACC=CAM_ASM_001115 /LENGTH=244 /DNA_ID=CAMNT_0044043899 /DNA_START=79 /DNA_END=813 /DNA_ORIENTATION=+
MATPHPPRGEPLVANMDAVDEGGVPAAVSATGTPIFPGVTSQWSDARANRLARRILVTSTAMFTIGVLSSVVSLGLKFAAAAAYGVGGPSLTDASGVLMSIAVGAALLALAVLAVRKKNEPCGCGSCTWLVAYMIVSVVLAIWNAFVSVMLAIAAFVGIGALIAANALADQPIVGDPSLPHTPAVALHVPVWAVAGGVLLLLVNFAVTIVYILLAVWSVKLHNLTKPLRYGATAMQRGGAVHNR